MRCWASSLTASRRKSISAPALSRSSWSAMLKSVATIGFLFLRFGGSKRMEPDRGHSRQESSHAMEFTPLPGTLITYRWMGKEKQPLEDLPFTLKELPSGIYAFGAVKLRARTLMGIVKLSIALLEDAPNVDSVVERALAAALALEMDRAALRGSGQGEEPRGVRFTEGVQLVPVNGALTSFDSVSEAVERIAPVNGPPYGLSAICSPRTWGQ